MFSPYCWSSAGSICWSEQQINPKYHDGQTVVNLAKKRVKCKICLKSGLAWWAFLLFSGAYWLILSTPGLDCRAQFPPIKRLEVKDYKYWKHYKIQIQTSPNFQPSTPEYIGCSIINNTPLALTPCLMIGLVFCLTTQNKPKVQGWMKTTICKIWRV